MGYSGYFKLEYLGYFRLGYLGYFRLGGIFGIFQVGTSQGSSRKEVEEKEKANSLQREGKFGGAISQD